MLLDFDNFRDDAGFWWSSMLMYMRSRTKRFSAPPKPRSPPQKNHWTRPPPPVASVWTYPPANDKGWYIRRFNMLQSPKLVIFHHPGQKFQTYLSKRRNTFSYPHKKTSGLGSKPSEMNLVMSLKLVYIYRVFGLLGPENPNYPITSMYIGIFTQHENHSFPFKNQPNVG